MAGHAVTTPWEKGEVDLRDALLAELEAHLAERDVLIELMAEVAQLRARLG
jgi:hypothetical protein